MKLRAIALIGIALVICTTHANAQQTDPVHFRTPFAFFAGDTLMQPGAYTMSVVSPARTVLFKSEDGHHSAIVSSNTMESLQAADRLKLIFHRYGSHYYISEIWTPGYRTGRAIVPHITEVELAKKQKQEHVTLYADATPR